MSLSIGVCIEGIEVISVEVLREVNHLHIRIGRWRTLDDIRKRLDESVALPAVFVNVKNDDRDSKLLDPELLEDFEESLRGRELLVRILNPAAQKRG